VKKTRGCVYNESIHFVSLTVLKLFCERSTKVVLTTKKAVTCRPMVFCPLRRTWGKVRTRGRHILELVYSRRMSDSDLPAGPNHGAAAFLLYCRAH
jgi:hypothetical protein